MCQSVQRIAGEESSRSSIRVELFLVLKGVMFTGGLELKAACINGANVYRRG